MDLPCCERIRRALAKRCEHPTFGYTFVPSAAWQHAARWLGEQQGWEHPLAEDNFVFSPSVVTSFYNIVQAFTSPSDGVLVFTPLYRPLQQVVEGSKRKLVCQSLEFASGQYRLDLAAVEAQLPLVRLVLLCNPQNPSGRAWRRDELDALAFACARHNVLVVSDEIHADWCLWGHKHSPFSNSAKATCCSHITLNAPTKTWNLAGLHCSYLVFVDMHLKQRYIDAVFHGHLTFNNVFASVALLTAYNEGLPWLCAAKAYIEDNISWLEHFLRLHIPEIVVLRPEATFLVWMDCAGLGLGADELDKFMISEARVILSSGREFSAETSLYQRLNCGCSRGKLTEAARRLERAVHGLRSMRSTRFPGAPNLARDHLLL
ncbi:hypothetical protein AB1Y20_001029 [Prymnesium parvum]|uniref:cysteine-S-conjugate beta-lyase n=1 Tax=Prymnesium parvum TaxID=97485 RepID=A0AB34KA41_PRYPA